MYIATASSSSKSALEDNGAVLGDMAPLVTTEDIEFMRQHGLVPVKRVCSLICSKRASAERLIA